MLWNSISKIFDIEFHNIKSNDIDLGGDINLQMISALVYLLKSVLIIAKQHCNAVFSKLKLTFSYFSVENKLSLCQQSKMIVKNYADTPRTRYALPHTKMSGTSVRHVLYSQLQGVPA